MCNTELIGKDSELILGDEENVDTEKGNDVDEGGETALSASASGRACGRRRRWRNLCNTSGLVDVVGSAAEECGVAATVCAEVLGWSGLGGLEFTGEGITILSSFKGAI